MGSRYTDEDNKRLISFIEDNPDAKICDLAEKAHKYGMFPERTTKALEVQIGRLKKPQTNTQEDQVEFDFYGEEFGNLREKHEELLAVLIDQSKPYRTGLGKVAGIAFDFVAIQKWLYKNEPKRINALFEKWELEDEREVKNE